MLKRQHRHRNIIDQVATSVQFLTISTGKLERLRNYQEMAEDRVILNKPMNKNQ